MKIPSKIKRIIRINFNDDSEPIDLTLNIVACIKSPNKAMYIDQLKDGTFRLNYTQSLVDDFSKVKNLEIIRED